GWTEGTRAPGRRPGDLPGEPQGKDGEMGIGAELRIALRALGRAPAFTVVATLTLALGIGANTAVFSLVDGVLLRPLPFADAGRLVAVGHLGRGGEDALPVSTGLYALYREHARSLDPIGLHQPMTANVVGDGEAERARGRRVTPSYFEVLGVPPALGRTLVEADGEPGAEPVVVLSDGLWRSRFGSAPAAVG